MDYVMLPNGTIGSWKVGTVGPDILFPEAEINVMGQKKLRGGAPVCCPNFGPAPTDGPYENTNLPQHGLVRECVMVNGKPVPGNPATHQEGPTLGEDGWSRTNYLFTHPWPHEVWIASKVEKLDHFIRQMHHRITLGAEAIHDQDMPYSIGFHPYFATGGNAFTLHHGGRNWTSYDLNVGEAFFVPDNGDAMVLMTADHKVAVKLTGGYNGYYVWTDRPDLYVCIEPVSIGKHDPYRWLFAGESVSCTCTVTCSPRR